MTDGVFRYEATDLATGRVKAVLQPISATFEETLSKPSSGSLVFATGDLAISDVWPGLTGLYISRNVDGQRDCIWAGFVNQSAIPSSPQTISVGVVSMDTYLNYRVLANADGGIAYNVDDRQQTLIAKDYVDFASWGGIPLTGIADVSEFEQEASYKASDYKNLGQALADLCAVINGPEYSLEHTYNEPGYWASAIRFQDHVGEDRNIMLKSDVDGLDCGINSDAQHQATRTYAIGAGEETQQLVSIAHDAASIYPEFHATPAWKDVSDAATLEAHAVGHVASFRDPVTTPSMSIAGMTPDPDVLRVGDTVTATIIAKSFRFDGKARLLSVAWQIAVGKPVMRVLTLQPVIRPALSILVKSIIPPPLPVDTAPTPGAPGEPVAGLVTTMKDSNIDESSGLAYHHTLLNRVYTTNDEGQSPQIFMVDLTTGNTLQSWSLSGVSTLVDPESVRVDPVTGALWIADIGDNDGDRATKRLIKTSIPASGASTNYNITYPGGEEVNAEALLIHPTTGKKYVATKNSKLIEYPATPTGSGVLKSTKLPANVSDGTFTPDGNFMLFTVAGKTQVFVVDFATGTQVDTISIPVLSKGESITMEPEGKSFLVGSEGRNSPIYRVVLPAKYRASSSGSGGTSPNGLPSGLIDLKNWKYNSPRCPYREVKQPALATFEDPQWFYDAGGDVVFRANAGGCTTSGSSYPRSELREMTNGGTSNASWNPNSGTHTIQARISMSTGTLSAKKHVVGMQVHDGSDDVCTYRLEGTNLYITDGDNAHGTLVTSSYVNGTKFDAKMVGSNGSIKVYYNGVLKATRSAGSGCYFKTGCYTQSNTSKGDSSSAYAEVRIQGGTLKVTHT